MTHRTFPRGLAIQGDVTDPTVVAQVQALTGLVPLIVADPPYGNVVSEVWDQVNVSDRQFAEWMLTWTIMWAKLLAPSGAFYVWGGIGRPGFRPFFRYAADVEEATGLMIGNLITWSKKRGYGVQHNYLFTREECLYLVKGDPKKPRTFHVPHLEQKRGYEGYDKAHPALSEYFRRTNVWSETEILRGKLHATQKADRVSEIPVEVHTDPGEIVLDLFAGSGSTSAAAIKLGRCFVAIERGDEEFTVLCKRLGT